MVQDEDEISATGPVLKVVPSGAVTEVLPEAKVVYGGGHKCVHQFRITWDNCTLPSGIFSGFIDSRPAIITLQFYIADTTGIQESLQGDAKTTVEVAAAIHQMRSRRRHQM